MFAKINEIGTIDFISVEKVREDMVFLNDEDIKKIQNGSIYQNGEILETEDFKKKYLQEKIQEIKQKYQDIIYAKYSLTDQLNMSNEAMQIMAFTQFEKRDFSEEEKTRLFEIQEAKVWVDTQRENCKKEILELGN